jgi:hypothetical protein
LDTIRIARDFGTVSQVLPPGLSLYDAPHTFVEAIRSTIVFLGWQDSLEFKEIPPKRVWLDAKKLDAWFKDVKAKREDEMKGRSNTAEGWDGDMVQNDAVRQMIVDD